MQAEININTDKISLLIRVGIEKCHWHVRVWSAGTSSKKIEQGEETYLESHV